MRNKKTSLSGFILLTLIVLSGCKENFGSRDVYKAPVGDKFVCLDKQYHSWGDDPNDSGIFITLMRPEMRPIEREERRNRGEYYIKNKISVSVNTASGGFAKKTIEYRLEQYLPTNEKKYGLSITKDISKAQSFALYIEPGFGISDRKAGFIRCSKLNSPNPQCSHNFEYNEFKYGIDYSIKQLPEWQFIKEQVISFIQSNVCEERN